MATGTGPPRETENILDPHPKDRVQAKLFRLLAFVMKLVANGERDPEEVGRVLHLVKVDPGFFRRIFPIRPVKMSAVGGSASGGKPVGAAHSTGSGQAEANEVCEREKLLAPWRAFYNKWLAGADVTRANFTNFVIPPRPKEGRWRLIVVLQGLTLNRTFDALHAHFPCSRWTEDLDRAVVKNDRTSTETYAVWVKDTEEADPNLKNLSANTLQQRGIQGETLLERFLHEGIYFEETGEHLDVQNWTLCIGSRYSDGRVPCVRWLPVGGEMCVDWYSPRDAFPDFRARAVVSASA